jgi:hypothetical protein
MGYRLETGMRTALGWASAALWVAAAGETLAGVRANLVIATGLIALAARERPGRRLQDTGPTEQDYRKVIRAYDAATRPDPSRAAGPQAQLRSVR